MDDNRKMELLALAKSGDRDAQCALFHEYIFLAKKVASEFIVRHPRTERHRDDINNEALMALYLAIPTYDPEKGRSLTSHYFQMVRYGLLDYTKTYVHNGIRLPAYVQKKKSLHEVQVPVESWEEDMLMEIPDYRTCRTEGLHALNSRRRAHIVSLAEEVLSEEQWEIAKHYFGFMHKKPKSVERVAEVLKTSVPNVRSTLAAVVRKLRGRAMKKCPQCQEMFHGRQTAVYCSPLCRDRHGNASLLASRRFVFECEVCGQEFARSRRGKGSNYCSIPCANQGRRQKLTGRKILQPVKLVCQHPECKKEFFKKRRGSPEKYCSNDCRAADRSRVRRLTCPPAMITCQNPKCGKEFNRASGGLGRKYCSYDCCVSHRRGDKPPRPKEIYAGNIPQICQNPACGATFLKRRYGKNKYCSSSCRHQSRLFEPVTPRVRPKHTKLCSNPTCGKEFTCKPSSEQKYCSIACVKSMPSKRALSTCANPGCDRQFHPNRYKRNGQIQETKYCSLTCLGAHRRLKSDQKLVSQKRLHGTMRVPSS